MRAIVAKMPLLHCTIPDATNPDSRFFISILSGVLMTSITEQLSATSKSHIESQLNLMDAVLRKSVEGVQQVVALNLNAARNVLERSTTTARELLEARDPREVLTLATKPLPTVEGLLSYSRELFGIASRAQVDLLQSASAQFRTLPAKTSAATQAPLRLATETAEHVAQQSVPQSLPQVRDVTHEVVDNVAAATEAIQQSAAQAAQVANEATTHAAQEAAAAARESAREAARASAEAAAPVQQATENVVAAASDNVEQATAAIAAAVAEAAPVTPAAITPDEGIPAPKTARGKPAAKPVAQALAEIADKAPPKSAPAKNQPRK
jgi:phasin family protein